MIYTIFQLELHAWGQSTEARANKREILYHVCVPTVPNINSAFDNPIELWTILAALIQQVGGKID
jgi:hypothetical protein